jgi:hypothetical protein
MGLVLPSSQKLTLSLLVAIIFEVVHFRMYAPFPAFLPFCRCILTVLFVRVFIYARDSTSITSVVAKSRAFIFILNWGNTESRVGGGRHSCCFWSKNPYGKRKGEMVRCRDAAGSSLVSKVLDESLAHLYAVYVKCQRNMRN